MSRGTLSCLCVAVLCYSAQAGYIWHHSPEDIQPHPSEDGWMAHMGHQMMKWTKMRMPMKDFAPSRESVNKFVESDIESAPYKVVKSTENYEIRAYPAKKWVCSTTEIDGKLPTRKERGKTFMRLFSYISGANKAGVEIKMTTPVTMASFPSSSGNGGKYKMCFFIPEKHQQDAPGSFDPSISMEDRPPMMAIATREGGYPDNEDWQRMADKLKSDAMRDGLKDYDFSRYYTAGYDSPMQFWNRRNEVWYLKADQDRTQEMNDFL